MWRRWSSIGGRCFGDGELLRVDGGPLPWRLALGTLSQTLPGVFAPRTACASFHLGVSFRFGRWLPVPLSRLSALTREGHSARLSRSPSLASAGCVLPFRGALPAIETTVRCGTAVHGRKSWPSSSPPTWGAHTFPIRRTSGRCPEPRWGLLHPQTPNAFWLVSAHSGLRFGLSDRGGFDWLLIWTVDL